ncbi:MAG: hypothetical protein FD127_1581 [Acidimicrobiaceae bacterium]|nr:MAG: hypothetical protein FD127_1581 [Acidimicrobiaceae bacterium]
MMADPFVCSSRRLWCPTGQEVSSSRSRSVHCWCSLLRQSTVCRPQVTLTRPASENRFRPRRAPARTTAAPTSSASAPGRTRRCRPVRSSGAASPLTQRSQQRSPVRSFASRRASSRHCGRIHRFSRSRRMRRWDLASLPMRPFGPAACRARLRGGWTESTSAARSPPAHSIPATTAPVSRSTCSIRACAGITSSSAVGSCPVRTCPGSAAPTIVRVTERMWPAPSVRPPTAWPTTCSSCRCACSTAPATERQQA